MWNCLQFEHLSVIVLPLRVELGGDIPSFECQDDQKDWGELTDLALEHEKFLEESKLLLFLDDCLYPA